MRRCIMRRRKEKGNFFCRGNWLRLAGYVFETLTSRFLFFKMDGCIENIIGYIVGAIFFFYSIEILFWRDGINDQLFWDAFIFVFFFLEYI